MKKVLASLVLVVSLVVFVAPALAEELCTAEVSCPYCGWQYKITKAGSDAMEAHCRAHREADSQFSDHLFRFHNVKPQIDK